MWQAVEDVTSNLFYGMFAQPGMVARSRNEPFGMYAAVTDLTQSILKYSAAVGVRFVCTPSSLLNVQDEVEQRVHQKKVQVDVLDEFIQNPPLDVNSWLDLGGDTTRPHRFRRRIGGKYPIGTVQYSVSYGYCLHSWFLPLLVGDVRSCDTVVCGSVAGRENVRKVLDHVANDFNVEHGTNLVYRGRLDIIPFGVDTEMFRPIPKKEARRFFKISDHDIVLLWTGRLSAQDKADLVPFLRIFKDLVNAKPDVRLRFVLSGGSRSGETDVLAYVVRDLGLSGHVSAVGFTPRDLLPSLYSAADVFVSPADSIQEMFGLTIVEAMACGVPVVCSDWGSYRELVVDGETGFLVPTTMCVDETIADDYGEWSLPNGELVDQYVHAQSVALDGKVLFDRLSRLVDDASLRTRMGVAGRHSVVEKYAWPIIVKKYDSLFQELREVPAEACVQGHSYSRTRFSDSFSHYPTRILSDDVMVVASKSKSKYEVRNLRPRLGVIKDVVAKNVLEVCQNPISVRSLVQRIGIPLVRLHVAWLLKYGHLELV